MTVEPTQSSGTKPDATRGIAQSLSLAAARRTAQQRRSSALYLIACAFLATAVLRANGMRHEIGGLFTSQAHAAAISGDETADDASDRMRAEGPSVQGAAEATAEPLLASNGEGGTMAESERCLDGAFLAAARERERELDTMELEIASRLRELEVVEKRVATQLAELTRQQEALQAAFGRAANEAEEEAMQLVSIYEKMKPKQAAQIFDQMPPAVASGFVRRMRKTNSALIMANMDPQKAYAVSLLLAARSGAVRQQ